MSIIFNPTGTNYPSFRIGEAGPTIYQGNSSPLNSIGSDGDIFIEVGTGSEMLFQKRSGTWSSFTSGSFLQVANNLNDVGNVVIARANLGLGTSATQNAGSFLQVANNLGDLSNVVVAQNNLGLGTAATQNLTAFLQTTNNLSDLTNTATARSNLGLGSAALVSGSITAGHFAVFSNVSGTIVDGGPYGVPFANASGSSDAITATFNPATPTLGSNTDGRMWHVRASGTNTTTTPTFSPDGQTPLTIKKEGGIPLVVGDIVLSSDLILSYNYNSGTPYVELTNPQRTVYDFSFNAGLQSDGTWANLAIQLYSAVVVGRSVMINGETIYMITAPTGQGAIFDILKNGTSIYAIKPSVPAGQNHGTPGTLAGTVTFTVGDYMQFICTQTGSGFPGSGALFTLLSVV